MKKQFKVVMLPTTNKSMLHLAETNNSDVKLLITSAKETGDSDLYKSKPQFKLLIIISTDKLSEEDWFYSTAHNKVFKCTREEDLEYYDGSTFKVVASSDKILTPNSWIPESFINKYAKSYNAKYSINEVSLEMAEYYYFKVGDKLKLNGSFFGLKEDSEITVKKFNHRNDNTLIEFEEDDEYNMGIHVDNLIHSTIEEIKTREDGSVIVHKNKTYSEEDVKNIAQEAWIESFFTKRNTDITGFNEWFDKKLNN